MAKKYTVVKDWITAAGYRAVIVLNPVGHHCGYVAITKEHPLYGKDYGDDCDCLTLPADEPISKRGIIPVLFNNGEARPDIVFDVHGGITYSGGSDNYPVEATDVWWFGYDCGHCDDGKSQEYIAMAKEQYPDMPFMWEPDGVFRDVEYNINECESLARQLTERVNFNIGAKD